MVGSGSMDHAAMQVGLCDNDLPALYRAADANSLKAQQRFMRETSFSLLMLVVAAIAGAFVWKTARTGATDWAGVAAAAAFATAALLRWHLLADRTQQRWYEGRAAAESAKTLAWRYAVGGEPFRVDLLNLAEADVLLTSRLRDILTDLKELSPIPPSDGGEQITPAMRQLRARPLVERAAAYEKGRIDDQYGWYSRKARRNEARAGCWGNILLWVEISGAVAALFKAIGLVEIDLLGLAGTLAAAGASLLQTRQHTTLAKAYSITAHDLSAIKARIDAHATEEDWARFIDEAEGAISKEHHLWRASRG